MQGGDCVCFSENVGTQRLTNSVTADLPTLFRLNRPLLQVGVGNNSLTVLSGSLNCPTELLAIGVNCNGQLGLGTKQNALVWKTLNKCYFPSPVVGLACGEAVTFYLTQSGYVWASGKWKCLVDSLTPTQVSAIPCSWKVKKISVGRRSMIMLGCDGCVYGVGDNAMGELGNGNTAPVTKPVALNCYSSLNGVNRQLAYGLKHPVERACVGQDKCCFTDEPVTYTRHAKTLRTAKYVQNGRISLSQRYNK